MCRTKRSVVPMICLTTCLEIAKIMSYLCLGYSGKVIRTSIIIFYWKIMSSFVITYFCLHTAGKIPTFGNEYEYLNTLVHWLNSSNNLILLHKSTAKLHFRNLLISISFRRLCSLTVKIVMLLRFKFWIL